jgi:iron complex outermembrane recepter protein
VQYRFNEHLALTGIVNNLRNTPPRRDETFNTYPYFINNFDPVGREYFLQLDYRF